jgi:hypothetical protein
MPQVQVLVELHAHSVTYHDVCDTARSPPIAQPYTLGRSKQCWSWRPHFEFDELCDIVINAVNVRKPSWVNGFNPIPVPNDAVPPELPQISFGHDAYHIRWAFTSCKSLADRSFTRYAAMSKGGLNA